MGRNRAWSSRVLPAGIFVSSAIPCVIVFIRYVLIKLVLSGFLFVLFNFVFIFERVVVHPILWCCFTDKQLQDMAAIDLDWEELFRRAVFRGSNNGKYRNMSLHTLKPVIETASEADHAESATIFTSSREETDFTDPIGFLIDTVRHSLFESRRHSFWW